MREHTLGFLTQARNYIFDNIFIVMSTEHISSALKRILHKKFPEIEMEIGVSTEPDIELVLSGQDRMIFNVAFGLHPYDYDKYISDGIDKKKWDNIRDLVRDFVKMQGLFARVKFYYYRLED